MPSSSYVVHDRIVFVIVLIVTAVIVVVDRFVTCLYVQYRHVLPFRFKVGGRAIPENKPFFYRLQSFLSCDAYCKMFWLHYSYGYELSLHLQSESAIWSCPREVRWQVLLVQPL